MTPHRFLHRVILAIFAASACLMVAAPTAEAQDRQALVMPGKRSLLQRGLSRPGALLRREPVSQAPGEALLPFSVFYIYARDPQGWFEVGRSSKGPASGWLAADQVIEWKQTLTVAFTNPAGRERVLFFKGRDDLVDLISGNDPGGASDRLRQQALAGQLGNDAKLVALEPDTHIDIARQFYLLPILEAADITFQSGFNTKILEVASVPLHPDAQSNVTARNSALREFKVGVVFLIDTTTSMDPYISRVRDALNDIVRRISTEEVGKRFRFSVIGYRNSMEVAPRLEYLTRLFANFEDGADPQSFANKIAEVKASNVDSGSFNEDALAGVKFAIDGVDWREYDGRYIVLVTDAGSRTGRDRYSGTQMGPGEIGQLAREKGISTFVMHLRTPAGARLNNHAFAERQYVQLAQWPNLRPLYFPVEGGDVNAFTRSVEDLTKTLLQQATESSAGVVQAASPPPQQQPTSVRDQAVMVGHAMKLAFLGRQERSQAPNLLRGWAADRDLKTPERNSFQVRLLLSKNQLSDLQDTLKLILEHGQSARLSPDSFFDQLRTAAAHLSRDPQRLGQRGSESIGALLGEYLDDLPYQSQIMEIDRDTWRAMGAGAQREVLDAIEDKLKLYTEFHNDTGLWVAFDGGRVPGDAVYPVPLDALP